MDSAVGFAVGFIVGVIVTFLVFMLVIIPGHAGISYRQGQIDAINGVIKYELKQNDDGTKTWEAKDE